MVTKKALLVGCNYPDQGGNELSGCCNDARRMYTLLQTRFGFPEENIDLLVDDDVNDPPARDVSTHVKIVSYLEKLVKGVESESDVLVFYFSGHGGLLEISTDNTGWNEAIYPNDMTNPITDDDIRQKVSLIPAGVNFTFISDSCCSGGLIDDLKEQVGGAEYDENIEKQLKTFETSIGSKRTTQRMLIQALNDTRLLDYPVDETNYRAAIYDLHQEDASLSVTTCQHGKPRPKCCKAADVGVLLSGCESWESSLNSGGDERNPEPYGVFTVAVEDVVKGERQAPTNREMVDAVRALIEEEWAQQDHKEGEEPQHPALYCSDANFDKVFICDFV